MNVGLHVGHHVLPKALGLTLDELRFAKATHIPAERYAFHKRELQAGRNAENAQMEAFGAAITDHLRYAVRRPDEVGLPPEDGG